MPPKNNNGDLRAAPNDGVVPPFKVGRNYMYDKHVDGYHAIMNRHDCSEIQKVFEQEILRNKKEKQNCLRLADLGCGTGRGTKLMIQAMENVMSTNENKKVDDDDDDEEKSPLHHHLHLFAVDKSAEMVKKYIKNIVPMLPTDEKVRILPTVNCSEYLTTTNQEENESDSLANNSSPKILTSLVAPDTSSSFIFPAVGSLEEFSSSTLISSSSSSSLPTLLSSTCDFVVCAWTLSHVMANQWGGDRWHSSVKSCVEAMERMIETKTATGGGTIFVIETLGTDTEVPSRKSTLHAFLEDHCGFEKPIVVRTDYKFESIEEGERMCLFFFGEEIKKKFTKRCVENVTDDEDKNNKTKKFYVLPEVTGIWIKRVKAEKIANDNCNETENAAPSRRERE